MASISTHGNGAARLPFKARLAYLLHVLWPVNLALFKASPHALEPTWVGQSSEGRCGQTSGPCGLDRGPLILHRSPSRPELNYLWGEAHTIRPRQQSSSGKHRGSAALKTGVFTQVKS
jgi:hypothetical protein